MGEEWVIDSNVKFRLNKISQSDAALQFVRSLQALQRRASSSLNNLESVIIFILLCELPVL